MKAKEISSLYRSYSPRMSHYEADGNGRDIYINHNNGGFWTQGVKQPSQPSLAQISNKYTVRISGKNIAPFKYHSDGSGRDSYVLFRSGGLNNDFKALNEFHLKDTLRTPASCIFEFKDNPTRDGIRTNTVYVSKQEYEVNKILRKNETGIIKRLYTNEKHKFMYYNIY
jgi:hypothetical protein